MGSSENLELKDESVYPDESILKSALGRSYGAYLSLLDLYKDNGLNIEWRYYKDGKAWLCKVQRKKKTIVWMSAWKGYVQAAIYVPNRMLDDILNLNISEDTKNRIVDSKYVGKLKPCIFEIRNKKSIRDFEKVMLFKMTAK